jgi:hypothetical protein
VVFFLHSIACHFFHFDFQILNTKCSHAFISSNHFEKTSQNFSLGNHKTAAVITELNQTTAETINHEKGTISNHAINLGIACFNSHSHHLPKIFINAIQTRIIANIK